MITEWPLTMTKQKPFDNYMPEIAHTSSEGA